MNNPTILNNKLVLEKAVKDSISIIGTLRLLGFKGGSGNAKTFRKYVKLYNIDISHFTRKGFRRKGGVNLKQILNNKVPYYNSTNLKNHLYKEGLKERQCELCTQGEEWNGMKISLILDHINGNNKDNRLKNLRIVCPNCDAGLPTYKGKNIKK